KPSGHMRITAPAGFGRRHVAPLVASFVAANKEVTASLDLSDRLADIVNDGFDLAVRIGQLDDSSLVGVTLAANQPVVVASPAYLEAHGAPSTPEDLARHNCLTFGNDGSQPRGWILRVGGKPTPVRVRGNMECNDGAVLHEWALAGHGLAWRSMWEVSEDIKAGRLRTVLDDFGAPDNAIHAVFPERRHLPLRVRLFIEHLKQAYGDPRYWRG